MKASLKNFHQSPRKVRLVADMIRGKSVPAARAALLFLPKKSAPTISKLLDSAVANSGVTPDTLYIKSIAVNKGAIMKRARPFARGRAGTIRKTMSIVTLELGTNAPAKKARAKKTSAKKDKAKTEETK